ncbi:hypothetical protein ACYF6T_40110 [Streptomyces sp. 7R007]
MTSATARRLRRVVCRAPLSTEPIDVAHASGCRSGPRAGSVLGHGDDTSLIDGQLMSLFLR